MVLSLIPAVAGVVRVGELSGGAAVTAANARFFAQPVPVLVHVLTALPFSLLGAFQFVAGFRRRWPRWHRIAGRVLVVCGLGTAVSGLWMTLFYPRPVNDGDLLAAFRLVFGVGMVVSIVLAFVAVRRRDFAGHRAWIMRGYAIGVGAGTQALTQLPWILIAGMPSELPRALLSGAAWVINLAVAEWFIRGRSRTSVHTGLRRPDHGLTRSVS
ncbi:DUF2306 domain-containing protein [Sphaerisporangium sp. NPDC051011]|uniref:DUF2306 domain-containing protein n=1 Tax=Sphaerisporangium sp. NPDC051011 TaxID=3155792 RepID=UPI0033D34E3F